MLNCEYCDYFKMLHHSSDNNSKTAACEFSNFIFTRDVGEYDIEPPCSNMSYQTYLDRINNKNEKAKGNCIQYTINKENSEKIGA